MPAIKDTLKMPFGAGFWLKCYISLVPSRGKSDSKHEFRIRALRVRFWMLLIISLTVSAGIWLFSGTLINQGRAFINEAVAFSNMRVSNVMVDVQKNGVSIPQAQWHIDTEMLKKTLPFQLHQNMFHVDPEIVRSNIETLSWVKKVRVRLQLPHTVLIVMEEREPFALWQHEGQFFLIDADGQRITNRNLDRYGYLPWLVGDGANTSAKNYVALMNEFPEIASRVRAASWVGGREWMLKMDNNIEVKLSMTDPRTSLLRLIELEKRHKILQREIDVIDLRVPEKTYVQVPKAIKDQISG